MRLLLLIGFTFLIACQQKDSNLDSPDIESSANSDIANIPISFSDEWALYNSEIQGVDFVIIYVDNDDDFRENINLMTEKLNPSITLSDYTQLTLNQLNNTNQKEILTKNITEVNGQPAQLIEFKANLTGRYLYYYQQYMMTDGKSYVLTFTSDIEDAEDLKPEVEKIFRTFQIPD